jgi:hypothetical protein
MGDVDAVRDVDFLGWFDEAERHVCPACHERAAVTIADALSSFCLSCGAIAIKGVSMEIPPERAA